MRWLTSLGLALLFGSQFCALQPVHAQHAAATPPAACEPPLAPRGGLPLSAAQQLSPLTLVMAALADLAYVRDFGTGGMRRPCSACLQAWGAVGEPTVVDSVDLAGGVSHCTVFRTAFDVFVLFRGLDELKSIWPIEMDTAQVDAAAYFKAGSPDSVSSDAGAGGNSTDVLVLRGFLRAHQAIEPCYMAHINRLASEMEPLQRAQYRVWFVGHSDGSSLAQLAALRAAATLGRAKLGGVFLFGTQRVGSAGFAQLYNAVVGNSTLRFQYGKDPATEVLYGQEQGLRITGRGFVACPVRGRAVEELVEVPLGSDRHAVCSSVWDPGAAPAAATAPAAAATPPPATLGTEASAAPLAAVPDREAAAGGQRQGRAGHGSSSGSVAGEQLRLLLGREPDQQGQQQQRSQQLQHLSDVSGGQLDAAASLLLSALRRQTAAAAAAAAAADGGEGHGLGGAVPGAGRLYHQLLLEQQQQQQQQQDGRAGSVSSVSSTSSSPATLDNNGLLDLTFLAHHMPSVFFDGLMRVLEHPKPQQGSSGSGSRLSGGGSSRPGPGAAAPRDAVAAAAAGSSDCTLAALRLPQCVVSSKCASALRQDPAAAGRCETCGRRKTCSVFWNSTAGATCDNQHPLWSGFLCYGGFFPPGLPGLLGFW